MDGTSIVAGAIPAVGGIVSGLLTNASNKDAAFENRETAIQMYNKARSDAVQDWDKQNAYNSPAAQMARYKSAGLNPNLIYGQSNTAQPVRATPIATPERKGTDYSSIAQGATAGVNAYISSKAQTAQSNNLEVQNTVAIQNAAINAAKAGAEMALMSKQGSLADTSAWKNLIDAHATDTLLPHQASAMDAHTEREGAETEVLLNRDEREAAMNSIGIKEAVQRIINMRIDASKIPAEIASLQANAAKLAASTELDNLDANLKKQGIQPHDSLFMRTVGQVINSAVKSPSGNKPLGLGPDVKSIQSSPAGKYMQDTTHWWNKPLFH